LGELERIREVMGFEPLRTVENPEDLPPGDAFRLFLPDIVPEGELELLTSFFLHRYHGEKPVSVNEDRFTDLERADAVMGGELLPSIVSRLRHLEKYTKLSGEKLTPELFRHIIQDMVYDHRVKLHPKDLRILNTLRKKPLTSVRSLSKLLGWSYTTTHRRVKRLRERCRLGVYPRLNYPRIGLTHLLILTEGEAHVESPYLLSRHELLGGDTYTLLSVAVPPRAVDRVFSSLEKRLPGVWTWTVEAFESVLTLDSYDPERGEWSINWDSWALTLYHALSRGWDQVIPQEDEYTPTPTAPGGGAISERDLKLIAALLEGFTETTRRLSRDVGLAERTTSRQRKTLTERGIIKPCLSIDHIGLNENIILIAESDFDTLSSLIVAVKRLPKAWIYRMRTTGGDGALACWLEAPPGSITPLERTIRRTLRPLARYRIFFRSNQEGSGTPPIDLYDPDTGTWEWNPTMLRIKP